MHPTKRQEITLKSEMFSLDGIVDRCRRLFVPGVLLLSDYFAVILAMWTSCVLWAHMAGTEILTVLQNNNIYGIYWHTYMPMIVIFFMTFDNMYVRYIPVWQQIERVFKVTIYSGLFIWALLYFFEPLKQISGTFTLVISIFMFLYLLLERYLNRKILTAVNLWQIPIILIGTGKISEMLINSFNQDSSMNYKVVGIIEDNMEKVGEFFQGIPIIGSLATVEDAVVRTGIKNVLLAIPDLSREALVDMIYKLQPHVRKIMFVPDISGVPVGNIEMNTLFDEKLVLLKVKNNLSLLRNCIFKQVFDIAMGIIICLCF